MKQPARLQKQEEFGWMDIFCSKYGHIIVFLLIILLLVLIATVILAFIDMGTTGNITMVESGNYYNHLKDVV